ncbi:MAG: 1-acyl-sn-glycerol-3-phosphate acyltransferase [Bacteroidetes bacterium]|nr:1-acyl-sn-glycerol-3-phosphate acyltransferase [Bacteroidota bacterium]
MILTVIKILYIGVVTFFLSVIALISLPFNRSGKIFHWCAVVWSKIILRTFGIRLHTIGLEKIERGKHYIFVSNHASMFDIPAVLAGIPNDITLVFKKELSRIPIWGWALRYGHFIMIDRSNPREAIESLERAAQSIQHGKSVLLFAEGTRTKDGKLQPFKRGAFSLAVKSQIPIVPVTINNTFSILPKGSLNIRPRDIELIIGEPIPTSSIRDRAGEQELMEQVYRVIAQYYKDQER